MKQHYWQIIFSVLLFLLSFLVYFVDYELFKSSVWIYLISDIAFLPIQVLLVTIIITQVFRIREKRVMLQKLNMVIGAFFSEVGSTLLPSFFTFDTRLDGLRPELIVTAAWTNREFQSARKKIISFAYKLDSRKGSLTDLKSFLVSKRQFLLGLLENPNLLEHESFTELLWAVFHLTEELTFRQDVLHLSAADYDHLSTDIQRAYSRLIAEWLEYMKHLKERYPYLFSLAVRTNPFDPNAKVEFS